MLTLPNLPRSGDAHAYNILFNLINMIRRHVGLSTKSICDSNLTFYL